MIGVTRSWITFPSQTSFPLFLSRWVWKNRNRNSKPIITFFYSLPSCYKGFPFLRLASTPPSFLLHFFSLCSFCCQLTYKKFSLSFMGHHFVTCLKMCLVVPTRKFSSTSSTRIIEQFHNWITATHSQCLHPQILAI